MSAEGWKEEALRYMRQRDDARAEVAALRDLYAVSDVKVKQYAKLRVEEIQRTIAAERELAQARADLKLQEEISARHADRAGALWKENEKARALLARLSKNHPDGTTCASCCLIHARVEADARAFLASRRDEARGAPECRGCCRCPDLPGENIVLHAINCTGHRGCCPARDEAPRCTCRLKDFGDIADFNDPTKHADKCPARDEAPRCACGGERTEEGWVHGPDRCEARGAPESPCGCVGVLWGKSGHAASCRHARAAPPEPAPRTDCVCWADLDGGRHTENCPKARRGGA